MRVHQRGDPPAAQPPSTVQRFAPIPIKLPKILGEDVAGVVVEAPEGSKVREGQGCCGERLCLGLAREGVGQMFTWASYRYAVLQVTQQ